MEKARIAKAGSFFFSEGAIFEIVVARNLPQRGSALQSQMTVCADAVVAAVERCDTRGDEFLVPARQCAIRHEGLEKCSDSQNERGNIGEGLEHVGHYTAIGQELVVELRDLCRNFFPLQKRNTGFSD